MLLQIVFPLQLPLMEEETDDFDVESYFNVTAELNKKSLKPGENLVLYVDIDAPEESFQEVDVELIIGKKYASYEKDEMSFNITYMLPSDMKSGYQEVLLQVEDNAGNSGEMELGITVQAIPSSIINVFSRKNYYANQEDETFSFKPVLYDQGGNDIDDKTIVVKIIGPDGEEVAVDNVISTTIFKLGLDESMKPGKYIVEASYEDIKEKSEFTVLNNAYVESVKDEVIEDNITDANETVEDEDIEDDIEEGFNVWKWLAITLLIFIVLFAFYSLGKDHGKKDKFKKDEFFNIKREKEVKKKKPKVIKADPEQHEED
jgi:hypothetical protein